MSFPKYGTQFLRSFLRICTEFFNIYNCGTPHFSRKLHSSLDFVYTYPEQIHIVLKKSTVQLSNAMKNTRGMPCGRGQTAPES